MANPWEEAKAASAAAERGDIAGSSRYNPFTGRLEGADFDTQVSDAKTFTYRDPDTGETKTATSTTAITETPTGVNLPKDYSKIRVNTSTLQGVYGASDPNSLTYNERVARNMVPDYARLPVGEQNMFQLVAEATGGRSGRALYERLVESSYDMSVRGEYRSPQSLVYGMAQQYGVDLGSRPVGGSSGSSGAYAGPRETITMASERDLRTAVDAMASQVLGRAATEDEFKKALEQVRTAEQAEPTITTTGVGRTVTQSGLTAEGRSDIIREALMQGPEAEDFGKATKMMDLFYSALEARPEGA